MPEKLRLSVDEFIAANTSGAKDRNTRLIGEITKRSLVLGREGKLKFTNFSTLTPFVVFGGNVDKFAEFYTRKHELDPREWNDWEEVLKELQDVFSTYFS